MSILPICITGEPVLHRQAAPLESFDSALTDLVADMIETMYAAPGVGLAAPQVGVGSQVFVWRYAGGGAFDRHFRDVLQLDDGPSHGFNTATDGVVVNPSLDLIWDEEGPGAILPADPDIVRESEGCLSVPGYGYPLRRALGAILRGYDAHGDAIEVRARGWLARIFQHEYDHLQGTLYVDRLEVPYADEAQRVIAERGWRTAGNTWTPQERA